MKKWMNFIIIIIIVIIIIIIIIWFNFWNFMFILLPFNGFVSIFEVVASDMFQGLITFLVNENGFNSDRVTKVCLYH